AKARQAGSRGRRHDGVDLRGGDVNRDGCDGDAILGDAQRHLIEFGLQWKRRHGLPRGGSHLLAEDTKNAAARDGRVGESWWSEGSCVEGALRREDGLLRKEDG